MTLSDSEITSIRETQKKYLPDTVYIQRLTRLSDGAGGWTEAWQTVATTKGRMAPSQRKYGEVVQGGALTAYSEYIVTLPYDTELQQDDRLQINGTQYEVKGILDRSEKTALRVIVSKV
ncbi:MAG: phage head closure protein [Anaerolineales bacterium]